MEGLVFQEPVVEWEYESFVSWLSQNTLQRIPVEVIPQEIPLLVLMQSQNLMLELEVLVEEEVVVNPLVAQLDLG